VFADADDAGLLSEVPLTEVSVPAGVIEAVTVGGRAAAAEVTVGGQLATLAEPAVVPEGGSLVVSLAVPGQ